MRRSENAKTAERWCPIRKQSKSIEAPKGLRGGMLLRLLINTLNDRINFHKEVKRNYSVPLLLADRPEIAELLEGHDALKKWMVRQFSGKVTKFPIQWDTEEPDDSDIAEHNQPRRNEPAKIRVNRNLSGLDQLVAVIFELFNIQNHKKFDRLWEKAYSGKIDKHKLSRRSFSLEYKAWRRCRRFLKKHASVFAAADDSNVAYSHIMSRTSFREYYAGLLKHSGGETNYTKFYEEKIVPFQKKREKKQNKN